MNKIKIFTLFTITLIVLSACFNKNNDFADANKLIVNQPCMPVKNNCEILLDKNIKLHLKFMASPSYQRLLPVSLESRDAVMNNITITMIIDGKEMPSEKMLLSENKKIWEAQLLPFAAVTKDNVKLRLEVTYNNKLYVAEFPVTY